VDHLGVLRYAPRPEEIRSDAPRGEPPRVAPAGVGDEQAVYVSTDPRLVGRIVVDHREQTDGHRFKQGSGNTIGFGEGDVDVVFGKDLW